MLKTSDKFETFYKFNKINEKSPIVFIHGIGLNNEIWDRQVNFFKSYNTIVYDIIGHGKTPLKKSQMSMKDFSNQLLELINELNLKKIHLVGFSLGSLIARDFASSYSDRLETLTIFGTVYKRTEDEKRVVVSRYESMKLNKDVSKKRALARWFNEDFIKKNPDIYNKIYSMLERNQHENWLKVYKIFVYHQDDDISIKQIKANTLIITGENDIGSTPSMSKNISKIITGSEFKIIKKGKHLCNIECAENFNVTIKEFIDNNVQS